MARTQHAMNQALAAEHKSFEKAVESRDVPSGRLELMKIAGSIVGRAAFLPGWRWSTSVKPIVGTESCQVQHLQYHVSGVLRVRMDDGTEFDCRPGEVTFLTPGHDAWVVGDEPVVLVDFEGMKKYAARSARSRPRAVSRGHTPRAS